MTMRLLPWTDNDGKPCFLSTDDDGSYLSRLADNLEAVQLGMAEELLGHVREVLAAGATSETELRNLIDRLRQALRDALRVAESRGDRLPAPDEDALSLSAQASVAREITASDR